MISTADFTKDLILKIDSQLWMIVDFQFVNPGKGPAFTRAKLKNLQSGKFLERTFKSGETFEEAELEKIDLKFIYGSRGKFVFCKADNPGERFDLGEEVLGDSEKFLKPDIIVTGIRVDGKMISINLPIKMQFRVAEAPPGVKGDRAQGGTKTVILENGSEIQVPLFVEQGETIEINTETGEYTRRM